MHAHGLHLLLVTAADQCEEVIDVTVHVAIGEQADEVQRLAGLPDALGESLPHLAANQSAVGQRLGHELGALVEDASAAERVVPHLAVAHVGVARHADGGAVGFELRGQGVLGQPVEVRRACQPDGIELVARADAHAVQDAGHDRPLHPREASMRPQRPVHTGEVLLQATWERPRR